MHDRSLLSELICFYNFTYYITNTYILLCILSKVYTYQISSRGNMLLRYMNWIICDVYWVEKIIFQIKKQRVHVTLFKKHVLVDTNVACNPSNVLLNTNVPCGFIYLVLLLLFITEFISDSVPNDRILTSSL